MSTYQRNYSEMEELCLARLAGPLSLKTCCLCCAHVSLHFPLRTALGVFLLLVCLFHENSPPTGHTYICGWSGRWIFSTLCSPHYGEKLRSLLSILGLLTEQVGQTWAILNRSKMAMQDLSPSEDLQLTRVVLQMPGLVISQSFKKLLKGRKETDDPHNKNHLLQEKVLQMSPFIQL